jgi:hypothetical protein
VEDREELAHTKFIFINSEIVMSLKFGIIARRFPLQDEMLKQIKQDLISVGF